MAGDEKVTRPPPPTHERTLSERERRWAKVRALTARARLDRPPTRHARRGRTLRTGRGDRKPTRKQHPRLSSRRVDGISVSVDWTTRVLERSARERRRGAEDSSPRALRSGIGEPGRSDGCGPAHGDRKWSKPCALVHSRSKTFAVDVSLLPIRVTPISTATRMWLRPPNRQRILPEKLTVVRFRHKVAVYA